MFLSLKLNISVVSLCIETSDYGVNDMKDCELNSDNNFIGDVRAESGKESSEHDEQFRQMFLGHSAPMLLVDQDSGGMILAANNAACLFYGYSMAELTSLTIDFLNIMPVEAIKTEMMLAKSKSRNYFNFVHRMKDGNLKHVEVYSSPVTYNGRRVLFSIILDSTEKKLYEIQLKDMNHRLNTRITAEMQHCREQEAYGRVLLELNRDAVFVFRVISGLPTSFSDYNTSANEFADGIKNLNVYDIANILKIDNGDKVIDRFISDGEAETDFTFNGLKYSFRLKKMPELCPGCAVLAILRR